MSPVAITLLVVQGLLLMVVSYLFVAVQLP